MKLIKWLAIWLGVGLGILIFAANAVAPGFAAYWAQSVLLVCLVLGLLFGISGQIRYGSEKRQISKEMEYLANSRDRRTAWAEDARKRGQQVWAKCRENEARFQENPLFQPEYQADNLREQMSESLAKMEMLQSDLRAVVQAMEEEGGAV